MVPVAAIAVGASIAVVAGATVYVAQNPGAVVDNGKAAVNAFYAWGSQLYYKLRFAADLASLSGYVQDNPGNYPDLADKLGPPEVGDYKNPAIDNLTPSYNGSDGPPYTFSAGDYITDSDGKVRTVNRAENVCGGGYKTCGSYSDINSYRFGYYVASGSLCRCIYVVYYNAGEADYVPSDQDIEDAINAHPDQAAAAVTDYYSDEHGPQQSDFPSTSSPVHIEDPKTGAKPNVSQIDAAVKEEEDRRAPIPTVPPQVKETVENSTKEVTYSDDAAANTRTRTEVITEQLADGSTRVTTRTEVTDLTTGEAISSTSETETESFTPPAFAVPDEKEIDFSPLLDAEDVLFSKFPLNLVHHVRDTLADLATAPEIPNFDVPLGPFTLPVRFSLISPLAAWFRGIVAFFVFVLSIWESIKIWR